MQNAAQKKAQKPTVEEGKGGAGAVAYEWEGGVWGERGARGDSEQLKGEGPAQRSGGARLKNSASAAGASRAHEEVVST